MLKITQSDDRRYRVATDFVAGLTEDLASELYHRLTGVSRGSILDAAARASRLPTHVLSLTYPSRTRGALSIRQMDNT